MLHDTVVFLSALAIAQDVRATGKEFLAACVVGYESVCRTRYFLGPSHSLVLVPSTFHILALEKKM